MEKPQYLIAVAGNEGLSIVKMMSCMIPVQVLVDTNQNIN